jgi:hypothetical protein
VLVDLDNDNKLPVANNAVFYLQVDNCGENKNRILFSFLTHLVRTGTFQKVKVGFLMVGHTHEDIDQFFSVIAKHLRKVHILCPDQPSLFKAVHEAFEKPADRPVVMTFDATDIVDYRVLYDPRMDDEFHYYQEPHAFRIKIFNVESSGTVDSVTLMHYKMWVENVHWLPCFASNDNVSSSKTVSDEEDIVGSPVKQKKKRKMNRGQITKGQMAKKIKLSSCNTQSASLPQDIPENNLESKDAPEITFTVEECFNRCDVRGILLLSTLPSLCNARIVQFSKEQIQTNRKRSQHIFGQIQSKFAFNYKDIFGESVMNNWRTWLDHQEQIWADDRHSAHPDGFFVDVLFPRAIIERCPPAMVSSIVIEDVVDEDLPDTQQFVTHSSGEFGEFNRNERLQMIRLTLAQIEAHNSSVMVVENMGCIFQFTHVDRETKTEKNQIALGIVQKIHTDHITDEPLYDIRFCPPKGAKPASKKRPDSLYQDIKPEMSFNLHYKSKNGKRVENEDKNLPRNVMLAFNLEMNKDGTICKRRMIDSKYNMSSFSLAENVITEFYARKSS